MTTKILFITGNQKKLEEIRAITGLDIDCKKLKIPEIQSLKVEEVAKAKALSAFRQIGRPVIVDDTGMYIEALNGLPGAFVSWFLQRLGPQGIIDLLKNKTNRQAQVSTCIAYADGNHLKTFTGTIKGRISKSLKGKKEFGYDPIFIPDGYDKTYAQMTKKQKNSISMRYLALMKFKKFAAKLKIAS